MRQNFAKWGLALAVVMGGTAPNIAICDEGFLGSVHKDIEEFYNLALYVLNEYKESKPLKFNDAIERKYEFFIKEKFGENFDHLLYSYQDLNEDGINEIFVINKNYCSRFGCDTFLFSQDNKGIKQISRFLSNGQIRLSKISENGYRNFFTNSGSIVMKNPKKYQFDLKKFLWDGALYNENKTYSLTDRQ